MSVTITPSHKSKPIGKLANGTLFMFKYEDDCGVYVTIDHGRGGNVTEYYKVGVPSNRGEVPATELVVPVEIIDMKVKTIL